MYNGFEDQALPDRARRRESATARALKGAAAAVLALAVMCGLPAAGQDAPSAAPAAAPAELVIPHDLQPDKIYRSLVTAENRGARLTVVNVSETDEYGPLKADPGRKLLVLATEWENVIPWTIIKEQKVPTTYKIPALGDHLYVVIDGKRLARVSPTTNGVPGHVPVRDLVMEKIGDRVRGNVVFEVPAGRVESMELRFYDFAHGHMSVGLIAPEKPLDEKPIAATQKNEVLETGVFGLKKAAELAGQKAPEGMTFVTADLRARSMFTFDGDATAFDPKARPGAKMKIGTVADWKEAHRYCQLVVDGEYGYVPLESGTEISEAPRFLPDVMTGGQVAFLVPANAKSLELRCDFPNGKTPGGTIIKPKGLTLPLEGTRPTLADKPAIVQLSDDVYRFAVTGQQAVDLFAGQKPTGGGRFLVLDVTVKNVGQKGEFFQTKEQLKYAAEDGSQLPLSPATYAGPYRPTELVWIPAGERRSFQAVFETKPGDKRPRLAFTGVSLAKTLDLKPIDAGAPAVASGEPAKQPATPVKQPATPVKQPEMKQPENVADAKADTAKPPVETKPLKDAKEEKPLRVPAKQPHKPQGLAGVGLTQEQVNRSIDRGADFLWNDLKKELKQYGHELGDDKGKHLLATLALVHAGAHKRLPDFDLALRKFLARVKPAEDIRATYDAGIFCMLVEAYGDAQFVPKMREMARWLLETQGKDGTWGYGTNVDDSIFRKPVSDRVLLVQGGRPLEGPGSEDEQWKRLTPWEKGDDGDTSVTQYALLGLLSASKTGVKLPAETWQRTLVEHEKRQCPDGGWNYHVKNSWSYGSMTAAGVCARAIARYALGEKSPAEDEPIERGLAWMNAHWSVTENPPQQAWHYYYLYALERVGRILDTEFIGTHEWYPLGAQVIVGNQKPDGSWVGEGQEQQPQIASSFALLFLTRATASLDAKPKHGGPGLVRTDIASPPTLKLHVILDCSGSMLEEMEGKTKFEIATNAVASLIKELPENAEVGLRAYGHRKRAIEPGASEDTELLIPMRKLDRNAYLGKLQSLRARGKTPLAQSLTEAARDASGGTEEDPVTVVLLTDGGEDTQPRKDPLKAADTFGQVKGAKLQIVGFDINREDWTQQLQEMARRSGGIYLTASKPDALMRELRSAVYRTPSGFVIVDHDGHPVSNGTFGQSVKLPEGRYKLRTDFAGQRFEEEFWINTDSTTAVTFRSDKVRPGAGAPIPPQDAQPVAQQPAATPQQPTTPANAAPKFCTNCGAALKPDARFCTNCGQKVAK